MKIKTCIVTGQYPPQVGGVGHSASRIANLLAHHGMDVHVVALQKHEAPLPFDESYTSTQEGKVVVHRVKVFYPNREMALSLSDSDILTRYNREMFQALEDFQRRFQYDVLHAFFLYPAGFIAGMVGKLHGIQTIASIRGNDVGKYAFDPLRMPFIRSALENATYVTSVATNLIELADRTLTPIEKKASTILNAVDPEKLRPRSRPDYHLSGIVIGTSGLFRYKKGLIYLFRALNDLKGNFDFTLLLVGDFFKKEDKEPHLEALNKFNLSDKTIITGKIAPDRMPDYLQLFDILVFPSLYSEGCPLSMLEAMAMKKTIIASKVGAIPEIIQDHVNGILVNPGCHQEISHAIQEVVNNPELRSKLSENAFKTAKGMTPEKEFHAWLRVYEFVLQSKVTTA